MAAHESCNDLRMKLKVLHIICHTTFCPPGLGWNYPCDLWSVGCILVELCSVSLQTWLTWCFRLCTLALLKQSRRILKYFC